MSNNDFSHITSYEDVVRQREALHRQADTQLNRLKLDVSEVLAPITRATSVISNVASGISRASEISKRSWTIAGLAADVAKRFVKKRRLKKTMH